MSRFGDKVQGGPKLPRSLLDKVSDNPQTSSGRNHGRRSLPVSRKDKRRNERLLKKSKHASYRNKPESKSFNSRSESESEPEETTARRSGLTSISNIDSRLQKQTSLAKQETNNLRKRAKNSTNTQENPKILPTSLSVPRQTKEKLQKDDAEIASLEKKLRIKSKRLPQSFYDDGLGDLVGDLGEDDSDSTKIKKRKSKQDEDWLASKRQKLELTDDFDAGSSDEELDENDLLSDSDEVGSDRLDLDDSNDFSNGEGDSDDIDDEDLDYGSSEGQSMEHDGFQSKNDKTKQVPVRVRENPYVPPTGSHNPSKYVPPALRTESTDDLESKRRLQLKTQGLLNRLTESNIISILHDIETLYQTNPRQYVTSTVVELLLNILCDPTTLNDTFIILHAGFITAMYKVIGPDFGAQMIEGLVTKMDLFYSPAEDVNAGKECVNIISLLSRLFNFQFITCDMIFDYIKVLLQDLSETKTELLLRIVRISGSQLRQDDPESLKDIVQLLQRTIAASTEGSLSVRTRFMIDTINDLKNNKLKAGAAASVVATEKAAQMKKTIGSLNTRSSLKATEPLRLTLEDIRLADKRGKWWLVGSSWKGKASHPSSEPNPPPHQTSTIPAVHARNASADADDDADDNDLLPETQDIPTLAQSNNMNTPLRRQIFATLLTSTDYRDAHTKLLKLNLTRSQQHEIPRILLHCVGAEKSYNHYYTLIAARLCTARNTRMDFQFCLWDFFKKLGVRDDAASMLRDAYNDDDDDEDDSAGGADPFDRAIGARKGKVSVSMRVNYAKMYGSLIADGAQSIRVLKPLDLVALSDSRRGSSGNVALAAKQRAATEFVEVLLITLILRAAKSKSKSKPGSTLASHATRINGLDEDVRNTNATGSLESIFGEALEVGKLHVGLKVFVKRVVRKSDLVGNQKEEKRVKEGCKRIAEILAPEPVDDGGSEGDANESD